MFDSFFQLLSRVNKGPHVVMTLAGIALVHVAAILLFTAVAPYLGSLLAFIGFALYALGARRRFFRPRDNAHARRYLFRA